VLCDKLQSGSIQIEILNIFFQFRKIMKFNSTIKQNHIHDDCALIHIHISLSQKCRHR
jgi:hypothetical protein